MFSDQEVNLQKGESVTTVNTNTDLLNDSSSKMVADDIHRSNIGLLNKRAMTYLILWYIFSTLTLFLNKHIVYQIHGDAVLLSTVQMISCMLYGFLHTKVTCGLYKSPTNDARPHGFYKNMIIVGVTRFVTVFLGLLALAYVTVSFTETVKSSAPIFTVLLAWAMTGEKTGTLTQISLIPIMLGLALCSAYDLSFHFFGFLAALGTNLSECVQNVFSKLLVSGEKYKYGPAEMQFFTSAASIVIQIPACLLLMNYTKIIETWDSQMAMAFFVNGICFHGQTFVNYLLLDCISPVTHSVTNTVKRALMIWLSVLWFGNQITFLSGLGTTIVVVGVFLYNKARQVDHESRIPRLESLDRIKTDIL